MTRLLFAFLLLQAVVQHPPSSPTPGNQTPTNTPPAARGESDPAAVTFSTGVGLLFVAVTPAKTADYEAVIVALQEALAQSKDAEIRAMASGWHVFKAKEIDAKSNALYVHLLKPVSPGVDYRPSLWLDKLLGGAPPELLAKYRDAFAGAPSKLALVEFAHMAIAPVRRPTNASAPAPMPPATPGNTSPTKPGNASPR